MPSSASSAGSIHRRSASSGTCSLTHLRDPCPRRRLVVVSARPARRRTISPSAQNVIPSPYDGERPLCHQTVSRTPSTYFRNSQPSLLLPMPAGPITLTSADPLLASRGVEQLLQQPNLVVAADERRLERSDRPRPPRSATTRMARQAGSGAPSPSCPVRRRTRTRSPRWRRAWSARRRGPSRAQRPIGAGSRY